MHEMQAQQGSRRLAARILVIDDNDALRDALRQVLAVAGSQDQAERPVYSVDVAPGGAQGLSLVERAAGEGKPYALAFVDIRMAQWDGIQTAEALWRADPDLQVVFCTAFSDYAWNELAARLGRSDRWLVLKKPFDAIEVRQLAAALATKWQLLQSQRRHVDQLEQQVEARVAELRRANRTLRIISRCHDAFVHSASEAELLDVLCQRLAEDGRYAQARISLPDGAAGPVLAASPALALAGEPPWCDGLQREVMLEQKPLVSRHLDCTGGAPDAIAASVVLPLRSRGEVLGALALYASLDDAFEEEEVRQLQEVADEIGAGIASLRDAKARARAEHELEYQASHDAALGLPRCALLRDRLQQAVAYAMRGGRQVAVLVLALERFHAVREALGEAAGNNLLRTVGERIAAALPMGDSVAHLSGGEFAVMLSDLRHADQAVAIASNLTQLVGQPFVLEEQEVFVNASVGISLAPADGSEAEHLLRNAAAAAHYAHADGDSAFHFYAPHMNERAAARLALESELHRALAAGELELHYQPKIDMRSGRAAGAEALLRWHHPQRGLLVAGEFIDQAEESGVIVPIGRWVIDAVCRQVRQWLDAGLPLMPVAINLSARQFRQKDLAGMLREAMRRHRVDAEWLELEIAASALEEQQEAAIATLRELKASGVRLTVDDFGHGCFSLSHLQRFPVDFVKIQHSCVKEMTVNPGDASICRLVIDLAHSLGLHVIAKGVESAGQARSLRQFRCDELQGRYFCDALPAEEFAQLLRGRQSWQLPSAHNAPERTLLLVDDEPNILAALRRLCRNEGYTVLAADNGRAALELMAARPVQVVLSDQRMPQMSGTEFLARARALQPDSIRMLLTGFTEIDTVIQAINQGTLFKFLTKPWDDGAVLAHLREAFDYHEMRIRHKTS